MFEPMPFYDPEPILRALRRIERLPELDELPERVRRLRTGMLKSVREARTAAIFAHGLATVVGSKVLVSPSERADFDFALNWQDAESSRFVAVQLKELVPPDLNPDHTLPALIGGLSKYPPTETVLLVLLNRPVQPTELDISLLPFAEFWTLWQSSPDGIRWSIEGDHRRAPRRYDFQYPS